MHYYVLEIIRTDCFNNANKYETNTIIASDFTANSVCASIGTLIYFRNLHHRQIPLAHDSPLTYAPCTAANTAQLVPEQYA